jgi:hypothetical protein
MEDRQDERQEAERVDRRPEEGERDGVEIAVDRAHVGLPVEEEQELAAKRAATHQPGGGLVEPDGGRGGRRQAGQDPRHRHAQERQSGGPPRPPRSLSRSARLRHASRSLPSPWQHWGWAAGLSRVAPDLPPAGTG